MTARRRRLAALSASWAVTLMLCLTSGAVRAQTDERFAMSLVGTAGFGGELEVDSENWGVVDPIGTARPELVSSALRPSLGGGLRLEVLPMRHVAVGASVTILGTETANDVVRRINDFGVFVAARLPVNVFEDGRTLTPYLLLPVGLSTGAGGPLPGNRRARLGAHVGLMAGVELEVLTGLSLFFEAGWQLHGLRYEFMGLRENWRANQAVIQLGLRAAR